MNKTIGIIGAVALALCGLPAAIDVITKGTANGYSQAFIALWGIGELFTAIYVYNRDKDIILMANYIFNLTFIGIILYYMI